MLEPEAQGNQSSSNLHGDRGLYWLKENKMDHILSASGDAVLRGTGKGGGGGGGGASGCVSGNVRDSTDSSLP